MACSSPDQWRHLLLSRSTKSGGGDGGKGGGHGVISYTSAVEASVLKLYGPVLLTFHWPSKSHDPTFFRGGEKSEYV